MRDKKCNCTLHDINFKDLFVKMPGFDASDIMVQMFPLRKALESIIQTAEIIILFRMIIIRVVKYIHVILLKCLGCN